MVFWIGLLRAFHRFSSQRVGWALPAVCLPAVLVLETKSMSTITSVSQPASAGRVPLSAYWELLQCRIARHYFLRVTQPTELYLALGRPAWARPTLPWWQPFVWRWLVLSGWLTPHRRRYSPRWDCGQ